MKYVTIFNIFQLGVYLKWDTKWNTARFIWVANPVLIVINGKWAGNLILRRVHYLPNAIIALHHKQVLRTASTHNLYDSTCFCNPRFGLLFDFNISSPFICRVCGWTSPTWLVDSLITTVELSNCIYQFRKWFKHFWKSLNLKHHNQDEKIHSEIFKLNASQTATRDYNKLYGPDRSRRCYKSGSYGNHARCVTQNSIPCFLVLYRLTISHSYGLKMLWNRKNMMIIMLVNKLVEYRHAYTTLLGG